MRTTQQFSITLPNEMAELVRSKVAAGEYPTEGEVVRDGLLTLAARDEAVEAWLRDHGVPAAKALQADSSRGIPIDQVCKYLTRKRARSGQAPAAIRRATGAGKWVCRPCTCWRRSTAKVWALAGRSLFLDPLQVIDPSLSGGTLIQ